MPSLSKGGDLGEVDDVMDLCIEFVNAKTNAGLHKRQFITYCKWEKSTEIFHELILQHENHFQHEFLITQMDRGHGRLAAAVA